LSKYNYIIIGAGIVGLATALNLLKINPMLKILVLEKENKLGLHQTGNNSGVIHSGIYYKPGSEKALNCREGYDRLLTFCRENEVKFDICGKLIVATTENELPALQKIYNRGIENGLENLTFLNSDEFKEIEPHAKGKRAILVPQTGIIDFKEVLQKYSEKLLDFDCEIYFNSEVINISERNDDITAATINDIYSAEYIISCAGLNSDRMVGNTNRATDFRIIPFRGEYYKLKSEKSNLVKNLIYPVPDPEFPFLGVHFTRKMNGEIEAGPNAVLSFSREGYNKNKFNLGDAIETFTWKGFYKLAAKYYKTGAAEFYRSINKNAFTAALQKLLPEIKGNDLIKGGVGIRAQACDSQGNLIDDFYFKKSKRILHVCNAPSPAATASLAIGERIAKEFIN